MAYSAPTKDQFTAIFPAFAAVSDEAYAFWSARAARIVDQIQACLGDDAELACMLATAHYLAQQGLGTGTDSQLPQGIQRIKSGTIEIERASGGNAASMGDWGGTSYGQQLYPMLKACVGGPRVTGTGCVLGGGGFNGFAGVLPPWGS